MRTLRLILGDQLNINHSWFQENNPEIDYVMMEVRQETDYAAHHIQKVCAIFLAMRKFSEHLIKHGHSVIYYTLDDDKNQQNIVENINYLIQKNKYQKLEFIYPDEFRLKNQFDQFIQSQAIECSYVDSEHFALPFEQLKSYFTSNTAHVMENFYRRLRKEFSVLMDEDKPLGGAWNFDKDNRKKLPKKHIVSQPLLFTHDVNEIKTQLEQAGVKTIGTIEGNQLIWPVTRAEAKELFTFFLKECLPIFGTYQDAMSQENWSVYHSRLSFALNIKLISPLEVIRQAEEYWHKHKEQISISQIEGFIRQILGWREFMRGMYWMNMPDFSGLNFFEHKRQLPGFFWTGETEMNCMHKAIKQSLEYSYAHHIQRLMLTGNYMLLTETCPDEADAWYLGIYIDAFEWVEMPNTRGMSQYADGGLIATKPYISSGNYINKMSDYCGQCQFNPKERIGETACPFNSLYWRFLDKHQKKLGNNRRLFYPYRMLNKFEKKDIADIYQQAEKFLCSEKVY